MGKNSEMTYNGDRLWSYRQFQTLTKLGVRFGSNTYGIEDTSMPSWAPLDLGQDWILLIHCLKGQTSWNHLRCSKKLLIKPIKPQLFPKPPTGRRNQLVSII